LLCAHLFAKQIQIWQSHFLPYLAAEAVGHRCFYLLPGHALGKHRQVVAHIDVRIQTQPEEILGGVADDIAKTPRSQ
jgi:hypothetical protein